MKNLEELSAILNGMLFVSPAADSQSAAGETETAPTLPEAPQCALSHTEALPEHSDTTGNDPATRPSGPKNASQTRPSGPKNASQTRPSGLRNANQKGGALKGGSATAEVFASTKSVLHPNRGGTTKGLQQYFTPPQIAQWIKEVVGYGYDTLDMTAGDGSLLAPFFRRYGVEIDADQVNAAKLEEREYTAIQGDIQEVYPLLKLSGVRWQTILLNPPFGLKWQQHSINNGDPGNSVKIAFEMAHSLLCQGGQGVLIGPTKALKEIAESPRWGDTCYALVQINNLFPDCDADCSVLFFARDRRDKALPGYYEASLSNRGSAESYTEVAEKVRSARYWRMYANAYDPNQGARLTDTFKAMQNEYTRRLEIRLGAAGCDVQVLEGKIQVRLTPLARTGLSRTHGHGVMEAIESLNGQRDTYFALNGRDWKRLKGLVEEGLITLHEGSRERIEAVLRLAAKESCPVYPVKPQQRLAYVEDVERLPCILGDESKGFSEGQRYTVDVQSEIKTDQREEVKVDDEGTPHTHLFVTERKILRVSIQNDRGEAVVLRENKEDIEYLLAHFDLPDPGDLATHFPQEMAKLDSVIGDIEAEFLIPRGVTLKQYQRDDICRLLFVGRGVLAWEQGLGKCLGSMVFAEACHRLGKSDGNALFPVPQDLLRQWSEEAQKFFGRTLTHITTRAQAKRIAREIQKEGKAPAWYITHYEALAIAGTRFTAVNELEHIRDGQFVTKTLPVKCEQGRAMRPQKDVKQTSRIIPGTAWQSPYTVTETLTTKDLCPECHADTGDGWNCRVCTKCGYVHKRIHLKPLAHELTTCFRYGCIVVDEGTKIKGDSQQSLAVRGLVAARKVILTGTPQKNYVVDLFWLLGWSLGFKSVRFPYAYEGGYSKFKDDYCVTEKTVGGRGAKVLPEVTNLSVLWRLLSASIVRRRKEQTGEPLQPRVFVPVTVPMGRAQRAQYAAWLNGFARYYRDTHPNIPDSVDVEKMAAILGQLVKLEYVTTMPTADPAANYWGVEGLSDMTPKLQEALQITARHAAAGEKVLFGSDVMLLGKRVADELNKKGIQAAHIIEGDGANAHTKDPKKRSADIAEFRCGETRVLCAGLQAIALGHNLDCASVVIIDGLPWDYATLDQYLARVHRLTSKHPVTIYVLMTAGSLDERKWQLLIEKGQSADLVLDGELSDKQQAPVSMQKILEELIAKGIPADQENQIVEESDVQTLWDAAKFDIKPLRSLAQAPHTKEPETMTQPTPAIEAPETAGDAPEPTPEGFALHLVATAVGATRRLKFETLQMFDVPKTDRPSRPVNTGLFAE